MLEFLLKLDRQFFLAINGWHSPFFDEIMYVLSQKLVWAPLYAILLIMLWLVYRRNFWYIVPLIILLVTLTDQVSVVLFKDIFHRLRPCHEPSLEGMVQLVRGQCGGKFGFISSHAANTFGVAIFAGSLLKVRFKWLLPVLIFWASIVCYSRVYLGVHYPGDVIVGALVGSISGYFILLLFKWIMSRTTAKQ
ncbi:MAG TPA: phosphatase PAP2 family protein [Lentimicrobium sp.]|nr:phosphatase PAP2 family protein [Lentimicrobium sp.]